LFETVAEVAGWKSARATDWNKDGVGLGAAANAIGNLCDYPEFSYQTHIWWHFLAAAQ
jgi:hypothetical protein